MEYFELFLIYSRSQSEKFNSINDVIRKTLYKDGPRGFFKGFSVVLTTGLPITSLYFLSYELSVRMYDKLLPHSNTLAKVFNDDNICKCHLLIYFAAISIRNDCTSLRWVDVYPTCKCSWMRHNLIRRNKELMHSSIGHCKRTFANSSWWS